MTQQAVGWALHALEPDEEMAVLLHLPHCAACRTAVTEAEEVLSALGGVVAAADPPPALRDRLMSAVASTEQRPVLQPRNDQPQDEEPRPVPVPAPAFPADGRRHRLDEEDRSGHRRPSWLSSRGRQLVAAALVVVAAVSVGGLAVRANQLEQQRDAESAQAQGLSEFISRLDQPGARHALLASADDSTVAAVLLAAGERQVYTLGLAANSDDHTYVLWGIRPDAAAPVPLGTFDVDAADQGLRTVGSAGEAEDFTQYAISLEPGRVAPASPTVVVASGQVDV
ncbi:anti-sigma factor domain-containing protein [Pseudonocardia petroleophila]|uniref:Regulator of SigK n=1 Tax=Pseudonocardia petroleophila TaxID=37331 RepID=A0A7G7MBL9_9PSEU|nr:anti-sigma factor [Pseudonocardia petroleophila]QNG50180.1 anti-sigma factor [Pseudonocardia petroleophila]